jgi:hypothetical protein
MVWRLSLVVLDLGGFYTVASLDILFSQFLQIENIGIYASEIYALNIYICDY